MPSHHLERDHVAWSPSAPRPQVRTVLTWARCSLVNTSGAAGYNRLQPGRGARQDVVEAAGALHSPAVERAPRVHLLAQRPRASSTARPTRPPCDGPAALSVEHSGPEDRRSSSRSPAASPTACQCPSSPRCASLNFSQSMCDPQRHRLQAFDQVHPLRPGLRHRHPVFVRVLVFPRRHVDDQHPDDLHQVVQVGDEQFPIVRRQVLEAPPERIARAPQHVRCAATRFGRRGITAYLSDGGWPARVAESSPC